MSAGESNASVASRPSERSVSVQEVNLSHPAGIFLVRLPRKSVAVKCLWIEWLTSPGVFVEPNLKAHGGCRGCRVSVVKSA